MIKEWIKEYHPKNEEEILSAMREIMQEITLAGLSRTDFFGKASFYGGTALRIFYGLDRFSEDLDFSLLAPNPDFSLTPYFSAIVSEFEALGMKVDLKEKKKKVITAIDSAFLKSETLLKEIVLVDIVKQTGIKSNKLIKIKMEVDREPPLGFETEDKLLIRPFSFYVNCFKLSSLFAGKIHALLFRKWGNRVKGRDWYDMEWYIRKGVPLDVNHFLQRAIDTGDWEENEISSTQILELLRERIENVSIESAKEDIVRFIPDDEKLNIWSSRYFLDLIAQLKFD